MSATVPRELSKILDKIDRPGSFCVSGSAPAVLPGLEVQGLGPVALPLTTAQAAALKKLCRQAPYGKGQETVVDTSVRRVWELQPERFALTNPDWDVFLQQTVRTVEQELGLQKQKLEPHLYDLLLYDPGSFFLPHRDGEKLERMVATLVVVLPSSYQGGELVVRHEGQEQTVDFAHAANPLHLHFAAFYADCEHEIRPLRAGHRLGLVYNLTLKKGKKGLQAPRSAAFVEAAARVLGNWARGGKGVKLAITLDHQYTKDGLAWDTLKGADRTKAQVLAAAARQTGCRAYLALLTLHEAGSAEYAGSSGGYGGYRRRGRWYDDEEDDEDGAEYKMGEIYEESMVAENCIDSEGGRLALGPLNVEEDEVLDPEAIQAVKPEEDFEGYTGNAGMTLDRWYRHGAILLWPESKHFEVLCDAGLTYAAEELKTMVNRWRQAGRKDATLREQCLTFAAAIIARWPENTYGHSFGSEAEPDALLASLALLGDAATVRGYLVQVLARDASVDPDPALVKVCQEHGWDTFQNELEAVFSQTTAVTLPRNVHLLEQFCLAPARKKQGWAELCQSLAGATLQALETADGAASASDYRWQHVKKAEILASLARSLLTLDQGELLARLVDHTLARPKQYPLTEAHVAALTTLAPWLGKNVEKSVPSLSRWLAACGAQLEALTAAKPQAPTDLRRPASLGCKCADCAELQRFLNDPNVAVHRFRVREDRRQHLANIIHQNHCDLDLKTERQGTPYTLVCTKNEASYQARLKKFHQDQKHLAALRAIEQNLPQ